LGGRSEKRERPSEKRGIRGEPKKKKRGYSAIAENGICSRKKPNSEKGGGEKRTKVGGKKLPEA